MGRWAAAGTANAYVRVPVRVVESLQIEAALKAAELLSGGQDAFGEKHVLLDMRGFALACGEPEEMVDRVLKNLTCANASLYSGQEKSNLERPDYSPTSPVAPWAGQS